jgi:glutamate synthase domain-containing protein 2
MVKKIFYWTAPISFLLVFLLSMFHSHFAYLFIIVIPYIALGIYDINSNHNVLRNYPILGHFRYILESVRPEIQQYFVSSNHSGRPFNREIRSVVYQRAHNVMDTLPFGTQQDIDKVGYEYSLHSLNPTEPEEACMRVIVGNEQCLKPYDASRLNISAMSFGALGSTSIEALNWGAKMGNFAQDTGEGGLSPYHLKNGGDIILQIGTGNFGFRNADGSFSETLFKEKAILPSIKMIEIKLSQGAKPSHGGLLPAPKVDKEIASIRGIPIGVDCLSPPTHPSFSTPLEMLSFVTRLRDLSGGKPVGFKLCIGLKKEFLGICKAMLETEIYPDFITIDGAEGGTGAAPLEFSNRLGLPINEALSYVHNTLLGVGLRNKIRLIASGKVATAYDLITKFAIGADMCNSARAMMFSLGCIQSLRCNTNECPTGIATQDPARITAVDPNEKRFRIFNYHFNTIKNVIELLGAMGINSPTELKPHHILHRVQEGKSLTYEALFPSLEEGALLGKKIPTSYSLDWAMAKSDSF